MCAAEPFKGIELIDSRLAAAFFQEPQRCRDLARLLAAGLLVGRNLVLMEEIPKNPPFGCIKIHRK